MISATAPKTHWRKVLKQLKTGYKTGNQRKLNQQCEITIFRDNHVELVTAGISNKLDCKTTGTVRFIAQTDYLAELIENVKSKEVAIIVNGSEITVGHISFSTSVTYFNDDSVLRTINVPINYDDCWTLKLLTEGYTEEEILFNRVYVQIEQALIRLESNITKSHNLLKIYGISKKEIREIAYKNLGLSTEIVDNFK